MPSHQSAFGCPGSVGDRSSSAFLAHQHPQTCATCPVHERRPQSTSNKRTTPRYIRASSNSSSTYPVPEEMKDKDHEVPAPPSAAYSHLPHPIVKSVEYAPGKVISFETGRIARQAGGAVVARQGDTMVICTACAQEPDSPNAAAVDFIPLRVDYAERLSAAGKTSGSYIKREGKPSQHETLVCRLIDRPLRPMFQKGYTSEVQLLANVFSYDGINPGDAIAICGCAAALHLSSIPLLKPVAAVCVAYLNNDFVISPTIQELAMSGTELVIAGTKDAILMIEGACRFLTEDQVITAVDLAQRAIAKICDALDDLRAEAGKQKVQAVPISVPPELLAKLVDLSTDLDVAICVHGKKDRERALEQVRERVFEKLAPSAALRLEDPTAAQDLDLMLNVAWKKRVSEKMRELIVMHNHRADGRRVDEVRPISILQRFLPCTHGSSLFTRGETQALAVATLGGEDMAQRFENLEGESSERFYLQYSFPPFSVGEVGRVGAPGRREIGHGKLAERALSCILPPRETFPYVVRVESSITESCGSSSMASVCGGCLALMDAGVPILDPVAGIAMGLIKDRQTGKVVVLTDILGLEDALGDMDFKVAGTTEAITALQMDIKIEGITLDIIRKALEQARVGRLHILSEMSKAQPSVAAGLPSSLPKVRTMTIPVRRIGDVIGPGGKTVRSIIDRCGGEGNLSINIEDDGMVSISSQNESMIVRAMGLVNDLAVSLEVGSRFVGTVTKILPFGAYVSIGTAKEGWLHISELEKRRTANVEDVCKVGDKITVQVIELGRNGQFRLSRKICLDENGVDGNNESVIEGTSSSNSKTVAT